MIEQPKLGRKNLLLILLALVSVNLTAGLLLISSPESETEALYLPDFESTLQLVNLAPTDGAAAESRRAVQSAEPGLELKSAELTEVAVRPRSLLSCRTWGPFAKAKDADAQVSTLLEAGALDVQKSTEAKAEAPDYLVYVGPYPSRRQAKKDWQKLQKAGIDAQVILRGRLKNAISVGVFGRLRSANRQQKSVKDLGFDVLRTELDRSTTVHLVTAHLDLENQADIVAGDNPSKPCEGSMTEIASATQVL